jgi:hypothetical protein
MRHGNAPAAIMQQCNTECRINVNMQNQSPVRAWLRDKQSVHWHHSLARCYTAMLRSNFILLMLKDVFATWKVQPVKHTSSNLGHLSDPAFLSLWTCCSPKWKFEIVLAAIASLPQGWKFPAWFSSKGFDITSAHAPCWIRTILTRRLVRWDKMRPLSVLCHEELAWKFKTSLPAKLGSLSRRTHA